MGRGLGPFQRQVIQRIGKYIATFGEAKVARIAHDLALVRGLTTSVTDDLGTEHKVDVANRMGLRRALAVLERRGLIVRYLDGSVNLTEVGAAVVGELTPMSKEESTAFFLAGADAFRRRREQAIAEGRLQSNGKPW